MRTRVALIVLALLSNLPFAFAQETATGTTGSSASVASPVPRLIRFSGTVKGADGKPLTSTIGMTFLLYKDQEGGAPLWMETQNVQPDAAGHYSVQLGVTKSGGLPTDVFASGEARWIGVQAQGQAEQPRVMLLAVPYALKAADAETLAGKPLSSFQLVPAQSKNSNSSQKIQTPAEQLNEITCASSTACKTSFIPTFSSNGGSATVSNSIISQSGTNINIAGGVNAKNINASGQISVNSASSLNPIFSQASAANAAAIVGFSTGTGLTDGVLGSTLSSGKGSSGLIGLDQNTNGISGNYTAGVTGFTKNPFGVGVLGYGVFSNNGKSDIGFYRAGVWGDDIAGVGVVATSDTGNAVVAVNTSATSPTLLAQNDSTGNAVKAVNTSKTGTTLIAQNNTIVTNGLVFQATAPNVNSNGSPAACQINTRGDMGCTGDVVQTRLANGLVKALLYFDPFRPFDSQIVRCYNSTLPEPSASIPPCGFNHSHLNLGQNQVDFGFTVNDRFLQATAVIIPSDGHNVVAEIGSFPTSTSVGIGTFYSNTDPNPTQNQFTDTPFYLTVF